jgi:hypothetical protein
MKHRKDDPAEQSQLEPFVERLAALAEEFKTSRPKDAAACAFAASFLEASRRDNIHAYLARL